MKKKDLVVNLDFKCNGNMVSDDKEERDEKERFSCKS